ncbi:MAG: 3-hydroxyacyl-ACP dehydratase FabZ [Oscillospiraceae bacterium]|nr:3-hydroxyacyl-ACP dehydratase FabZ [Oscillospiraceae bacterium]
MMNLLEINKRIKQRPPFQMIERVLEIEPNVYAVGIKNVSVNEPYFTGHFPETPIMPGVLLIESAAQLCSLVIAPEDAASSDKLYVLLKVKDFKFLKPVIPGDTLTVSVRCIMATAAAYEFSAVISVDETVKAKGSMLFTAIDKSAVYDS